MLHSQKTLSYSKNESRERFRLVIVDSESQAEVMLTLKDLDG